MMITIIGTIIDSAKSTIYKILLVPAFGLQTKSIMVCYGIFWSGQLLLVFVLA